MAHGLTLSLRQITPRASKHWGRPAEKPIRAKRKELRQAELNERRGHEKRRGRAIHIHPAPPQWNPMAYALKRRDQRTPEEKAELLTARF